MAAVASEVAKDVPGTEQACSQLKAGGAAAPSETKALHASAPASGTEETPALQDKGQEQQAGCLPYPVCRSYAWNF